MIEKTQAIGRRVLVEQLFDEQEYDDYVVDEEPDFDIKKDFSKSLLTLGKIVKKIRLLPSNRCRTISVGSLATLIEEGSYYIFNPKSGVKLTYGEKEYLLLDGDNDFYLKIDL